MNEPTTAIEDFAGKITASENFIGSLEQLTIEVEHSFGEGLYRRKATAPKDSVIISMVHLHDNFAFIMTGEVTVISEDGPQRIKAPAAFLTKAGTKRMIIAHEESIWYTVHALPAELGEHSKIEDVEDYIACGTLADYDRWLLAEQLKLEA
jgi:hypothetical protein